MSRAAALLLSLLLLVLTACVSSVPLAGGEDGTPEVLYLTPDPASAPTPQIIYITPEPVGLLPPISTPRTGPNSQPTPEPTSRSGPRSTPRATPRPTPRPTPTPRATPRPTPRRDCDRSYPDVCIPPAPPDLNCDEVPYQAFRVRPPDPHDFDGNGDGIGCEG